MSRPRGSGFINEARLLDALEDIRRRRGEPRYRPSRQALAAAAGLSDSGVRDFHRALGMSWEAFWEHLDFSSVIRALQPVRRGDDPVMKMLVDIDPAIAEAVIRLARNERRDPRDQVAVILREAMEKRARRDGPRPIRAA